MKCRFSAKEIPTILDFGKMPLGNGFLDSQVDDEYFLGVYKNTSWSW